MEMMGKSQVLSFWELLDIFAWYTSSQGLFCKWLGGMGTRSRSWIWGKLKKAKIVSFLQSFLGFLKLRL
jgi:hypothetical protein